MLNLVYALSLVELPLDLAEVLAQTLVAHLVHQPDISAVLNLVYELGNGIDAWVLVPVYIADSFIVRVLIPIAPVFQSQWKQSVSYFYLYLCRIVNCKLPFYLRELL